MHMFAKKYQFKGPWDGTGKLIKQTILNSELKYERCSDTFQCDLKLRRDLTKDNNSDRMKNLREYESKGDLKAVENTIFTTTQTYIGYGTEYKDEYQRLLLDNQYDHIVFTDRENIPDMQPLPFVQVHEFTKPTEINEWKVINSHTPCTRKPY